MTSCDGPEDTTVPVLRLQMTGRGENAMRMDKRLRCAGRAVGVRVEVDWKSEHYGDPVVYFHDKQLTDHLMDTEEIERLLQRLLGVSSNSLRPLRCFFSPGSQHAFENTPCS